MPAAALLSKKTGKIESCTTEKMHLWPDDREHPGCACRRARRDPSISETAVWPPGRKEPTVKVYRRNVESKRCVGSRPPRPIPESVVERTGADGRVTVQCATTDTRVEQHEWHSRVEHECQSDRQRVRSDVPRAARVPRSEEARDVRVGERR